MNLKLVLLVYEIVHLQETKEETLKKLFVGGLSRETTDDQFRDYFMQFGNVTDHIVIKDGGGISKYVFFHQIYSFKLF
jgi:RNA recognition motif-containing protein